MLKIGIIGYGVRIQHVVNIILESGRGDVVVSAIADPDIQRAKKSAEENGISDCHFYATAEEMLACEALDGVCIGTRCSLHTKYALLVAKRGIPLYLEKPVCINDEDLARLCGILHHSEKTVVSFPLRTTEIVRFVKELIDSGKIGDVAHIQAVNNVPYGRGYFHKWYRDETETGGLFLQKATHDLDYINYLLGDKKPVSICAMKSKQVFRGDKPAALKCEDCPETKTCTESPENVAKFRDGYSIGPYCCFATDTGNEDSGSVLVQYENGVHIAYSQNFIVRGDAGRRGARIIGYKGTIEFDFYTGVVTLYNHLVRMTEEYRFQLGSEHFGGDATLAENFIEVMRGTATSATPLSEGILSAKMCLAARKSSVEGCFVEL